MMRLLPVWISLMAFSYFLTCIFSQSGHCQCHTPEADSWTAELIGSECRRQGPHQWRHCHCSFSHVTQSQTVRLTLVHVGGGLATSVRT